MSKFEELRSLFVSNPQVAIEESQKIICSATSFDSFKEFYSYHLQHPQMSTCQKEWRNQQMSIHCFDCSNNPQSCICLQCFLHGNHQGHEYIIRPDSTGNCDCGDLSLWKRSGFCNEHHGVEDDSNPENYLEEKLREVLTDTVFKAIFSSLTDLRVNEDQKITVIFRFLSSFLKFGDGFRRLITIALTQKIDFESLIRSIFDSSAEFNRCLQQLCGNLVNDTIFKYYFSRVTYKLMLEVIIPKWLEHPLNPPPSNSDVWENFWFHSFSSKPIEYNITHFNWDWVSFILQYMTYLKEIYTLVGKASLNFTTPSYLSEVNIGIPFASEIQPNEQTQHLFDELFTKVFNCGTKEAIEKGEDDTKIVASFIDEHQENYYRTPFSFKILFFDFLNSFKLKKNLKLDKLFEELDKSIDISSIFCLSKNTVGDNNENENDKFISKFLKKVDIESITVNDAYFKSFHNGASFYYSHHLFDSLLFIFRSDNINRVKTARILSMGKYQNLRVQLGIMSLKYLLSFVCLHQSLTCNYNHSLKLFLSQFINNTSIISFGIPYVLPLFQLILGLQCNDNDVIDEFSLKEFFAFEMAREVGVFDNFESESYSDEDIESKKIQMIFSVLYVSILLVIERTLFNFNGYKFIKEQIIFALKQGISHLDELNSYYDKTVDRNFRQTFNKIISQIATANRHSSDKKQNDNGNDSSFKLKEGVEWKSITAINQFNSQKVILNNEISKSPNNLINIPEFEPEENYFFHPPKDWQFKPEENEVNEYEIDSTGLNIRLKEFLFTPTILALTYHTLRKNCEKGKQKADLNDHLAMMILVLISRFAKDINEDSQPTFNESTTIQYDSTLVDLISKLKREVFKLNFDKEGNATIKNTINNKSFDSFIKMKFKSGDLAPKSFIDILLEKGEIGKNVLSQMSVDISNNGAENQNSSLNQEKINKLRANKLKESIINQFKNAISNYNDTDQIDESPSPSINIGDICSICTTSKNNEILSYTLYIYRTKFPFIIDKPPLTKYDLQFEIPVDNELNDIIFDENMINNEREEEEEEAPPDLDEMLASIPNFEFNNEDEDQNIFYRLLRQTVIENYQKRLQAFEEKMIRRKLKQNLESQMEERKRLLSSQSELSKDEKRCTAGFNYVIQFGTCQHPVHPDCVNKEVFNCPIDRSLRNGFLPAIEGISKDKIFKDYNSSCEINEESLSDEIKQSISLFIRNFTSFFINPQNLKYDLFVELVKSISGLISTYEIRLRSLPDCLDLVKTKILPRNLFLTTWYAYRINGKPKMKLNGREDIDVESRLTTFQKFIKHLIENDDIISIDESNNEKSKNVFKEIVSSFVNSPDFSIITNSTRKEKEIYLFLKRACLSAYFLLGHNVSIDIEISNFIDWDEILSASNLSEIYKVPLPNLVGNENDGNEFEFKPFVFSKLPKEFLHFALKPYEFEVDQTQKWVLYNLLDYNFLIRHYSDFDDYIVSEEVECEKNKENVIMHKGNTHNLILTLKLAHKKVYPTIYLSIGKSTSDVIILNEDNVGISKTFYVDRFGCADSGYERGQPLFLSEERYEAFIDEVLSGDFAYNFNG